MSTAVKHNMLTLSRLVVEYIIKNITDFLIAFVYE